MTKIYRLILTGALACMASARPALAHEHIAAGLDGAGRLALYEAGSLLAPTTLTVYHMLWVPEGLNYGGYYSLNEFPRSEYPNDYFTFTALSNGLASPDGPNYAPSGSDLWIKITGVQGPEGSSFGFWESGASYSSTTPTSVMLSNSSGSTIAFEISEPIGDGDPFGHIHDRGFTVDMVGDYYVSFVVYDASGLGAGGGPLAAESQAYGFHFQAIPEPSAIWLLALGLLALVIRHHVRTRRQSGCA